MPSRRRIERPDPRRGEVDHDHARAVEGRRQIQPPGLAEDIAQDSVLDEVRELGGEVGHKAVLVVPPGKPHLLEVVEDPRVAHPLQQSAQVSLVRVDHGKLGQDSAHRHQEPQAVADRLVEHRALLIGQV